MLTEGVLGVCEEGLCGPPPICCVSHPKRKRTQRMIGIFLISDILFNRFARSTEPAYIIHLITELFRRNNNYYSLIYS